MHGDVVPLVARGVGDLRFGVNEIGAAHPRRDVPAPSAPPRLLRKGVAPSREEDGSPARGIHQTERDGKLGGAQHELLQRPVSREIPGVVVRNLHAAQLQRLPEARRAGQVDERQRGPVDVRGGGAPGRVVQVAVEVEQEVGVGVADHRLHVHGEGPVRRNPARGERAHREREGLVRAQPLDGPAHRASLPVKREPRRQGT